MAKKNKTLKEVLSIKGPELNRQIFESKDRNGFLTKEIETFKVNMQKEIQCLEDKGIDKMKIFHENAETRLKSLWNRSQFDYEQLSKRLNDHLKTYSDNVTGLLADFSNKIENDESNFDNKPKENGEKVKINGNGNVVNHGGIGQSPTNKTARNQGSGKKNNKNPIAVKK